MRRAITLVCTFLLALGIVAGASGSAGAKPAPLLTFTLTERPYEQFPGACLADLTWTIKDPSRVTSYYYDAVPNPVTPPGPLPQPKNKDTDLPYSQTDEAVLHYAGVPGDVLYFRVLVRYSNGTYSPWQYETVHLGPC